MKLLQPQFKKHLITVVFGILLILGTFYLFRVNNFVEASTTFFMGGTDISKKLTPPILYYNFDEGHGTTVYDYKTITSIGTLVSGTAWINDGKFGRALSFDGNDDYVDIPYYNFNRPGFTFSFWIKTSTGDQTIFNTYSSTPRNAFYINSNGTIKYNIRGSNGSTTPNLHVTSLSSIKDNNWHHIVSVKDDDNVYIYIDGKRESAITGAKDINSNSGRATLGLGANGVYHDIYDGVYSGLIDEFKIYEYALSPDQVKLDYNNGMAMILGGSGTSTSAGSAYCVPGDTSYCASPVAEYKFDKKSGGIAYDTSGNGNDGTINGATSVRGKNGNAMSFDGVNDSLSKTSTSNLKSSNGTISYWLYIRNKDISQGPIHIYQDNASISDYARSYIGSNNIMDFVIEDDDTSKVSVNYDLDDLGDFTNKWLHFSWVQDGNSVKLYINGQIKTLSGTNSGSWWTSHLIDPIHLRLGHAWYYFNGLIDEVRIYNYARTPAQIAWDYNKGAPIAHYKFDECSGTTIHDESGNGNNGTISIGADGTQSAVGTCIDGDTTHAWYNGRIGRYKSAMNFDGTNDYIDVGGTNSLGLSDQFSISVWTKFDNVTDVTRVGNIIGNYNYSPNFNLEGHTSGRIRFYWNGEISLFGTKDLRGTWHHVVVSRDKISNKVIIYIDGILEAQTTAGTNLDIKFPLRIGGDFRATPGLPFHGKIDDLKMYNYALTPTQVKELYNGGVSRFK
ncbi:MAG: LamG domain-containing protein [Patescibacteria group bacterium]|nr:LamG domain-containing protein [Patescibacteria group bacterium]